MPVVLDWLEEDAVTWTYDLDRTALSLAKPDAFCEVDGLPVWMGVPSRTGAGSEVDAGGGENGAARGGGDCVDVDITGEPVGRALGGIDR